MSSSNVLQVGVDFPRHPLSRTFVAIVSQWLQCLSHVFHGLCREISGDIVTIVRDLSISSYAAFLSLTQ